MAFGEEAGWGWEKDAMPVLSSLYVSMLLNLLHLSYAMPTYHHLSPLSISALLSRKELS